MKQGIEVIREHLNVTGVSIEEEAFLAGVICGIRTVNISESTITYIGDLESRRILWLGIPCINKLSIGQTEHPLTIETLFIYSDTERTKINTLDSYALKFIQSVDPYNIGEYVVASYVSVGGCIYERRISFLSLGRASVPRFMVCKLSVSSHSHIALPKIMRNGDNHYFGHLYPRSERNECAIRNRNSIVIGPEGELYKCWNDVGDTSKVFGHLGSSISNEKLLLRYLVGSDPFEILAAKSAYYSLFVVEDVHILASKETHNILT